jgi:HEAT repeat protein
MSKTRYLAVCAFAAAASLAFTAATARAADAAAPASADKEKQFIAILQSDAPLADKAIPCKQLAIYGTKAAVPALAPLLATEQLSSWARIALEAITDPEAADALRDAAGKLKGKLLIGVINSLAVKRDVKAVDLLVAKLKDADADVVSAAGEALGRIGGDAPAKALEQFLPTAPEASRSGVAYGCNLCAERFLAEGKADQAVKLYDLVRKSDAPRQRQLEATRGAILARGPAGVPMMLELLKSVDKGVYAIGLRVARELPGAEATDALVAEVKKAAPDQQGLLLLALADRGDAKGLPVVLDVATNGQGKARVLAIGILEKLGNASCVPVLLEAAVAADPDLAAKARTVLARMSAPEMDADIVARMPKAEGKLKQVLIELAGVRRIDSAMPGIVACAADPNAVVRGAAISAIGAMGTDKQIADLIKCLDSAKDPKDQSAIEKALQAISVRAGAAAIPQLQPLTASTTPAVRIMGFHALACAGGPDALAALKAAAEDKDEAVADEVVRTLSTWANQWPEDPAILPVLLAVAKADKKPAHQVLAIRGYMQFVQGTKKTKDDQRIAMVKEATPLLTRPEEKRLAIGVLGNIRSGGVLEALAAFVEDTTISDEAASAIIRLASAKDGRGFTKDQRTKALQTVIDKSQNEATKKKADDALKTVK